MCRIMQELIDEELKESHLEIAETLLRKNVMSKEEIAEMCSLTLAEVEQLAASLGR